MKTKVVCDTNIWYNLGEGILKPETLNKYCLIATFYNFEELNATPKTVKNFHKVRRAARAMVDHSCEQNYENAILYLAKLINPNHEDKRFHYNLGMRGWNEMRLLGKLPNDFQLTDELIKLYQENINGKITESEQVANIENTLAQQVQKQSRKLWKENKTQYYKSSLKGIVGMLNAFLKDYSDGRSQLTIDFDIKQIELFLTAFVHFYKNLEIGKMVAQPNDMYDLFNMIYVKPGMKYLTMEKRWNNIIKEAGLSDYLLTLP